MRVLDGRFEGEEAIPPAEPNGADTVQSSLQVTGIEVVLPVAVIRHPNHL